MIPERLTDDTTGPERDGHEFRYHLARGFMKPGQMVLDLACGTAYGAAIVAGHGSSVVRYLGVDREALPLRCCPYHRTIRADLMGWSPVRPFHVGLSFETIEHLPDYRPLVATLKQARRWILASVPVVPTVGRNPWHLHDFKAGDLVDLFQDQDWRCFQLIDQPSEVSQVAVFCRR